jgi:hypothetical protein
MREPRERCWCGDPECRRCYPRASARLRRLADDDYGDARYEQRRQDELDERWEREQGDKHGQ